MAKAPEQGLRDPFNKWGIGKGVEEAADIVAPVKAAQAQITELVKMLARPGLNREARVTLSRELAEKRKQLKTLELDAKRTAKDFQSQKNMQVEILYKLSGIRSQMARKDLGPDVLKTLIASEKRLEDLYKASKNTKSVEALQELLKSVKDTQKSLESLPDDVADALNENDEIMQKVLDRQDEARKYLRDQKESFKKFKADLKDKFVGLGMDIADRLGVGRLNLGNVLRGIGAVYRAGSWGVKTIKAMNLARKTPEELAARERSKVDVKEPSETIAEKFSQYVADTRVFHRRSLQLMKGKNAQAGKMLIGPLIDSLKNLFLGLPALLARKLPIPLPIPKPPVPVGAATSGTLAAVKSAIVGAAPAIGAAAVPVTIAGALLYLGKEEKERIEANPNAAEFKDNPYAMKLRHEANSLRQAGLKNQRKALKVLPPGVAMQYLEAGVQPNGLYLDGYTKAQLLSMAAGKPVDLSPEQNADWGSEGRRTPVSQIVDAPKAAVATSNAIPLPNNLDLFDMPLDPPPPQTSMAKKPTESTPRMGSGLVKDHMGSLFVASGKVKLDGLHPNMQRNMVGMAKEYYETTGKKLQLNDAFRTYQDQERLYRTKPKGQAAPPGKSVHEYGLAFDTQSDQGDELSRLGLLSKYGFSRPVKGERWHIQPKGVDLAVAKSGIYSGDAPVNSGVAVPQAAAVSETEGRMPTPKVVTPQQTSKSTQAKPNSVVQPSTRLGIADIPTFDMSAGSLMAMNLGVVG